MLKHAENMHQHSKSHSKIDSCFFPYSADNSKRRRTLWRILIKNSFQQLKVAVLLGPFLGKSEDGRYF